MEKLKHLYLPKDNLKILEMHHLPNLETLVNYHLIDSEVFKNLMAVRLTKLKKLTLRSKNTSQLQEMFLSTKERPIAYNHLRSLCVKSEFGGEERLDLDAVTTVCPNLYKLSVQCEVGRVPEEASKLASSNLTKVHLKYCGLQDLSWLGKLQKLTILLLECDSFVGTEMHFQENEFPQLKHLELDDLENLREWKVDAGAMPSLCRLEINWCENLGSVPEGLQEVENLKELEIRGMPLRFRERLDPKTGEDYYKVKHVRHISFVDCDDGED